MGKRGPSPNEYKARAMAMLRAGLTSNLSELEPLIGVSAQRIGQWCDAEGLDWREQRRVYFAKLWSRAKRRQRMVEKGKTPKRPGKAHMRAEAERLVAEHRRKQELIK